MPIFDNNQPGTMKESIRNRLPRAEGNGYRVDDSSASGPPPRRFVSYASEPGRGGCLPTLWTVASILSLIVNVVLFFILVVALLLLGGPRGIQELIVGQASGLLGGLYDNFVLMDRANIRTTIHVEKDIPVQFALNVNAPATARLAGPVRITGARVWVQTGGLTITNADATILLPAGVDLPITIRDLVVPVDQKVPAVLDVPVDIPLSQTELHTPFIGLRQVIEPYYCLVQKFRGILPCPPTSSGGLDQTLVDPALRNPASTETVVP